jgi:hypothetical protein
MRVVHDSSFVVERAAAVLAVLPLLVSLFLVM